jgi:excisionase family DNA binding protein
MRTPKSIDPNAFAYSPADAARFCGLGLTRIKALLRDGTIAHRKDGRRTLVLRSDIEAYLTSLAAGRLTIHRGERGRFTPAMRPGPSSTPGRPIGL